MNPLAIPFVALAVVSAGLCGLAKAAEVSGPLGFRRTKLVASLIFHLTYFAFMIFAFWQDSWKAGPASWDFFLPALLQDGVTITSKKFALSGESSASRST